MLHWVDMQVESLFDSQNPAPVIAKQTPCNWWKVYQKSTCKQNFAHKNHITVVANSFITPTSRQRVGPYSPFLAFAGVRATPPGRVDTLVTTEIPKAPCAHLMLHSWAKKCDSIQSSQITTVYGVCIFHHIYIYIPNYSPYNLPQHYKTIDYNPESG